MYKIILVTLPSLQFRIFLNILLQIQILENKIVIDRHSSNWIFIPINLKIVSQTLLFKGVTTW